MKNKSFFEVLLMGILKKGAVFQFFINIRGISQPKVSAYNSKTYKTNKVFVKI